MQFSPEYCCLYHVSPSTRRPCNYCISKLPLHVFHQWQWPWHELIHRFPETALVVQQDSLIRSGLSKGLGSSRRAEHLSTFDSCNQTQTAAGPLMLYTNSRSVFLYFFCANLTNLLLFYFHLSVSISYSFESKNSPQMINSIIKINTQINY